MKREKKCQIRKLLIIITFCLYSCVNTTTTDYSEVKTPLYYGVADYRNASLRNFEKINPANILKRYFNRDVRNYLINRISKLCNCQKVLYLKLYKINDCIPFHSKLLLDNNITIDIVGFVINDKIYYENFGTLIDLDLMFFDVETHDSSLNMISIYGELVRNDYEFLSFQIIFDYKNNRFIRYFADLGLPYGSF